MASSPWSTSTVRKLVAVGIERLSFMNRTSSLSPWLTAIASVPGKP